MPDFEVLFLLPPSTTSAQRNSSAVFCSGGIPEPSSSPSRTPSPSPTPSTSPAAVGAARWLGLPDAAAMGYTGAVSTQSGAESDGRALYVCRAIVPRDPSQTLATSTANETVPGKFQSGAGGCEVVYNGTAGQRNGPFDIMLRSPYIGWTQPFAAPAGSAPIVGGTFSGVQVCRAWHPVQRAGPHGGFFDPANASASCVFAFGGSAISGFPFEVLVTLPPGLNTSNWVSSAPVLLPSVTPSRTPPPVSPSPSPAGYQEARWVAPDPNYLGQAFEPLAASVNSSVCRAYVEQGDPGDRMPGSWSRADPGSCTVASDSVGVDIALFDLLLPAEGIAWIDSRTPINTPALPLGSTRISAGVFMGLAASVCRAKHPVTQDGPFAGYTDGEVYGVQTLTDDGTVCFIVYKSPTEIEASVHSASAYDVLVRLGIVTTTFTASASAAATATASASASPSATASSSARSRVGDPTVLTGAVAAATAGTVAGIAIGVVLALGVAGLAIRHLLAGRGGRRAPLHKLNDAESGAGTSAAQRDALGRNRLSTEFTHSMDQYAVRPVQLPGARAGSRSARLA